MLDIVLLAGFADARWGLGDKGRENVETDEAEDTVIDRIEMGIDLAGDPTLGERLRSAARCERQHGAFAFEVPLVESTPAAIDPIHGEDAVHSAFEDCR